MNKPITTCLFLIILIVSPLALAAEPIYALLTLEGMRAEQITEKRGDELYMSVTEYSNQVQPRIIRTPRFPRHWLSHHVDKLQGVVLWKKLIQSDESIELIIALLEHDSPPWNVDDHLGSVKLICANGAKGLKTSWSAMDYQDGSKVSKKTQVTNPTFILEADGGRYVVSLKLTTKNTF